jgi:hypothetical protein
MNLFFVAQKLWDKTSLVAVEFKKNIHNIHLQIIISTNNANNEYETVFRTNCIPIFSGMRNLLITPANGVRILIKEKNHATLSQNHVTHP